MIFGCPGSHSSPTFRSVHRMTMLAVGRDRGRLAFVHGKLEGCSRCWF